MAISRKCRTAPPLKGGNTEVCMWGEVPDVIISIKFNVDWLMGFWFLRVWKSGCSTDKASRPYNNIVNKLDNSLQKRMIFLAFT